MNTLAFGAALVVLVVGEFVLWCAISAFYEENYDII